VSVKHATFTLEREYPRPPARVFAMWSEPAAKAQWFAGPDSAHHLDFRPGGREIVRGRHGDGPLLTFESVYHDIVQDARIVYASTMSTPELLTTVSLTTVLFLATEAGTRLVLTEQGVYLDGHEEPHWREQGTESQLDALGGELRQAT
jgi:uncharacterized protein YndB with AHSA1/START domain